MDNFIWHRGDKSLTRCRIPHNGAPPIYPCVTYQTIGRQPYYPFHILAQSCAIATVVFHAPRTFCEQIIEIGAVADRFGMAAITRVHFERVSPERCLMRRVRVLGPMHKHSNNEAGGREIDR